MKFTIQPGALLQMIAMASGGSAGRQTSSGFLRLGASQGRVWVEWDTEIAAAEVAVWEEGQCEVSRAQLWNALRRSAGQGELLIEADEDGLRAHGRSIPVRHYRRFAPVPAAINIFVASDLGCVS